MNTPKSSPVSGKTNVWARRKARRALVQAVYQAQLSGNSLSSIRKDFRDDGSLKKADIEFFDTLLAAAMHEVEALDGEYAELLDRAVEQLDHVERAVLRLATVELRDRLDVPYKVVIDEYVELAKVFGAQDSHKYINGILDALSGRLREIEVQANK